MQDVKKELDLSFQQRFSNRELHFYEQIMQLESLVENTNKLQTDQLLKELDTKNNILIKLLHENISRKFSNTPSQNDIIGRLTRQPSNNLEDLHESSPQCQDFNTAILNKNALVNRLEKENAIKIVQNIKINDQLMEKRKSCHQEYMLSSNMVITDCNKNKDDTVIPRNVNNKEKNESINKNDTDRVKTKKWLKGKFKVKV